MLEKIIRYIQANPRWLIVIFFCCLALIPLGTWLVHFIDSGTVTVKSDNPSNSIVISNPKNPNHVLSANGKLHTTLATGQYIITVSNIGANAIEKKSITVKRLSSTTYTINPENNSYSKANTVEPVLPLDAISIVANSSRAFYLNTANDLLYSVSEDGVPSVASKVTLANITWQTPGHGVGMGPGGNTLFEIKDGDMQPITLPFQVHKQLFYDLPLGGKLVVSDGRSVYVQTAGGFRKIFTADSDDYIPNIGASSSAVLVQLAGTSESDPDDFGSSYVVVGTSGKKLVGETAGPFFFVYHWAPGGGLVAGTTGNGITIYSASFKPLTTIQDSSISSFAWLNARTLLYAASGNVFAYDINSRESSLLATIPTGDVSGIYPSQDGSQIYIEAAAPNNGSETASSQNGEIVRLNLKRSVPDYIVGLGIFLPESLNQCSVSYANFTRAVVLVTPPDDASAAGCVQAAQESLSQDEINTNKLPFITTPPPPQVTVAPL